MSIPQLSAEQRAQASAQAAKARAQRAELKARLKHGGISLAEVLEMSYSQPAVARMRVSELLESMPSTGKVKAHALMEQFAISPSRRIQGLGTHQRNSLLRYFG